MKRYLPLLAILALLGAFAAQAATAAAASTVRPGPTSVALDLRTAEAEDDEGEEEGEEGEFGLEECETEDFGLEFDEEEGEEEDLTEAEEAELEEECGDTAKKAGKDDAFVTAPAACKVSRAESTIAALPAAGQVRLTLRYRTWAPTPVTVALKLRDRKGAVAVGHTGEHLAKRGVLHVTVDLGDSVMDRTLTASEFDVSLDAPSTPGYCAGALEQRLRSVKHTGADGPRVFSN